MQKKDAKSLAEHSRHKNIAKASNQLNSRYVFSFKGNIKMAKIIIYDQEARQKILAGVEKLEKAVSVTLGPSGRNVIIDEFGSIHRILCGSVR